MSQDQSEDENTTNSHRDGDGVQNRDLELVHRTRTFPFAWKRNPMKLYLEVPVQEYGTGTNMYVVRVWTTGRTQLP